MEKKLEAPVYSQEGKVVGSHTLAPNVFGVAWNADLVHEVVISMQGNARSGTAHTKGRGDVHGGGKKPWKQKGTGRARHGSSRSPIWVGGGVSHGPRTEKDYSSKINKNARAKALACVLSQKVAHDEIILVDTLTFGEPQAKEAKRIITALSTTPNASAMSTKRKNAALVVLSGRDMNTELSFRNFGHMDVVQAKDVNPVELLTYKYVIIAKPDESLKILETRAVSKAVRSKAAKVTTVEK